MQQSEWFISHINEESLVFSLQLATFSKYVHAIETTRRWTSQVNQTLNNNNNNNNLFNNNNN